MTRKKNDENDENNENVEKINTFLIIKKLFDQKNHEIIDIKRSVSDVKKNHIDVLNI